MATGRLQHSVKFTLEKVHGTADTLEIDCLNQGVFLVD